MELDTDRFREGDVEGRLTMPLRHQFIYVDVMVGCDRQSFVPFPNGKRSYIRQWYNLV